MKNYVGKVFNKILGSSQKREATTRKYTRHMIKKYGKTLKRLSYE